MTTLTSLQEKLLRGIQSDSDAIRSLPEEYGQVARIKRELATLGVPIAFAVWTGLEMEPATRKACGRALEKLEAAGLVERSARWGINLTHAKLTPAGEALAKQLVEA